MLNESDGVSRVEEFSQAMNELEAAEALANLETFVTTLLKLARQNSDLLASHSL
jgi:hypothetical protein